MENLNILFLNLINMKTNGIANNNKIALLPFDTNTAIN